MLQVSIADPRAAVSNRAWRPPKAAVRRPGGTHRSSSFQMRFAAGPGVNAPCARGLKSSERGDRRST